MRDVVKSDRAPAALGPYSQAIKVRGSTVIYCAGQVALDPTTGALTGGTAAEQARQVLANLKAVIEAAGAHLSDVAKTTIYLTDLNDFQAVNEVYASFFVSDPPARATIQVAGLPKGAKVEIDAVAVLP
ncbi:MAG: Rid family detoxifying hydrolase [Candidatus Zixiibacteriota bacterium]